MEKLEPKSTKQAKAVLFALPARNEDGSVPISESEQEENSPHGICGLKYFVEKLLLKGQWIG
jgi:hypothetical protein